MKRGTPDHPKLHDLCSRLNLPRWGAVGLLESLWHFTAGYALAGDIGRHSNASIARALGWDGDADLLVDAFTRSGWIDRCQCHRLRVHDWDDHADQTVTRVLSKRNQGFIACYDDASTKLALDKDGASTVLAPDEDETSQPLPLPLPLPEPSSNQSQGPAVPADEPLDPVAAWRRKDERTLPQLAEAFLAYYGPMASFMTREDGIQRWVSEQGGPPGLDDVLRAALERVPKGVLVPDDFGPPGEREALLAEGEPIVASIGRDEGLDPTEVASIATEFRGHKYTRLDRIPTNRHTRLVHSVNFLRAWRRRLDGKPGAGVASKESAGRKSVGERTADTVRRMIARRKPDAGATDGAGAGNEIQPGTREAGRRLPPGTR